MYSPFKGRRSILYPIRMKINNPNRDAAHSLLMDGTDLIVFIDCQE